ncbi:MAG TPA: hypothetical protein PKN95_03685 [Verrucomicrobiota bacterium]|nr:hypothetical protein [Verrucomicrobiota bacterium]HNT14363.1 hypothetical protein [Verrucomicrobiota bacterium]
MSTSIRQASGGGGGPARRVWGLGGAAGLVFLITLSHWLTPASLGPVARWAGWSGQLELSRPLSWLLFSPLRGLPAAWWPLTWNLLTAGLAVLVLMQLARSVSILRYDAVTIDPMRARSAAGVPAAGAGPWLPPAFAVAVLALQQSFWEHATAATGEMASVLCFALAFRAILEYRRAARERWLYAGAWFYALGMADNWMMIAYAPVYLAALIWARGFGRCLEARFFWRLTGCALLGWSVYFLVPWMVAARAAAGADYWPTLRLYGAEQKNFLRLLSTPPWRLFTLTAVLPFLLLAVRWRSHSVQLADDTHAGIMLTKVTGHTIHLLFLLAAVWLALNPWFAPGQNELSGALLVYHYAWSLVAGYGLGYLLQFRWSPRSQRARRWPGIAAAALCVVLPLLLTARNFPTVWLTNGPGLKEFAGQIYDELPDGRTVALSDAPWLLPLVQAECDARDGAKSPLLLDTRALATPAYRAQLAARYGARWPEAVPTNAAPWTPAQMAHWVQSLAAQAPAVYLHSSSGLFLENFVAAPQGWTQRLIPRQPHEQGVVVAPSAEATKHWQARWEARWEQNLRRRSRQFAAHRRQVQRWNTPFWRALHLSLPTNATVTLLGDFYGKTLNQCGVDLRRNGAPAAATVWFQRALQFSPDNLAAHLNLAAADPANRGASNRLTLAWARQTFPRLMARHDSWPEVISRNGPVDAPVFLRLSGLMYLGSGCPQQAWECFDRSMTLAPDWLTPRLEAAQTLNVLGRFSAARALSRELLSQPSLPPHAGARLLQAHAVALWGLGRTNEALEFIASYTAQRAQTVEVVDAAVALYDTFRVLPAELQWSARLVELDPQRAESFVKRGRAELRAGNFAAARATLAQALELAPANRPARWLRAGAAVAAGQWADAEPDYRILRNHTPSTPGAADALGSWPEATNILLRYYHALLANAPAVTSPTRPAREPSNLPTDE